MTKVSILLLRLAMGWLFLYAGVSKILNPEWTAAGYLKGAKTFPALFHWFASSQNIGWVDFLNEWGLALIGGVLILGLFVKWASFAGIVLMLLYYFPVLKFPYAGANFFIIDDHIIFILIFVLFIGAKAGQHLGIDGLFNK